MRMTMVHCAHCKQLLRVPKLITEYHFRRRVVFCSKKCRDAFHKQEYPVQSGRKNADL